MGRSVLNRSRRASHRLGTAHHRLHARDIARRLLLIKYDPHRALVQFFPDFQFSWVVGEFEKNLEMEMGTLCPLCLTPRSPDS
jgi:hypothetical protein